MSKLGEIILKKLSRDPHAGDYLHEGYERKHLDIDYNIKSMLSDFPDLSEIIIGKKILDVGCAGMVEIAALIKLEQDLSME